METMSLRFEINEYIHYNKSISRKNYKRKDMITIEINKSKKNNEGEKK